MSTSKVLGVFWLVLTLAACGSHEAAPAGDSAPATVAALPASLEGELEMSVTEGDAGEDGGAGEITFGALRVGGDEYLVEVDERTLAASGITVEEFKVNVRATLGAKSEWVEQGYVITSLARVN